MTIQERSPFKFNSPGPYLAIVRNHLDPGYMGGLEVSLLKGFSDNGVKADQLFRVQYLTPFYGATSVEYEGPDAKNYKDAQKSYGFWAVPPDVGTTVMVVFLEGDSNQGYWLGCVQDRYQNHMVPGLAAAKVDPTLRRGAYSNYEYLPVTEYNKRAASKNVTQSPMDIGAQTKPIFTPFAKKLLDQGLLGDTIRGVTSSSARREIPSMVFGLSTPGPLDKEGPRFPVKYGGKESRNTVPVSRLGGSTFVMDDGDADGNNELVRLRTRTGHQILLHNTADLIYIGNAKGTAWIELTASGKIDIFAQDSVSIHTEADFNFKAGRSFNVDAANINMHALGNINIESKGNFSTRIGNTGKIATAGDLFLSGNGDVHVRSNSDLLLTGAGNAHVRSGERLYVTSGGQIDILSGGDTKIGGAGPVKLNERGDPSTTASFELPETFATFNAPATSSGSSSEVNFSAGSSVTILQRVPMHEPWSQHENNDVNLYSADNTEITPGSAAVTQGYGPNQGVSWTPATFSNSLVFTSAGGEAAFAKTTAALQTAVKNIAAQYKQATGRSVIITSSFRSYEEQKSLYNRWKAGESGIFMPVNPDDPKSWPNTHARGIAIDTSTARDPRFQELMEQNGLYRPLPSADPVHVVLVNARNKSSSE